MTDTEDADDRISTCFTAGIAGIAVVGASQVLETDEYVRLVATEEVRDLGLGPRQQSV